MTTFLDTARDIAETYGSTLHFRGDPLVEEQLPATVDQRAANLAFAAHVQLIRMYADDTDVLTLARTAERAALDMIRGR